MLITKKTSSRGKKIENTIKICASIYDNTSPRDLYIPYVCSPFRYNDRDAIQGLSQAHLAAQTRSAKGEKMELIMVWQIMILLATMRIAVIVIIMMMIKYSYQSKEKNIKIIMILKLVTIITLSMVMILSNTTKNNNCNNDNSNNSIYDDD